MPSFIARVLATLFLSCIAQICLGADAAPRIFTPQELRDDLAALDAAIARIHPNIEHSVAKADYAGALESARSKLDHSMNAGEAWTVMCQLNSILADAHMVVGYPGGAAAELNRYVQSGGRLFPFNVYVDPAGELFIRSKLDGTPTPWRGSRIEAINGESGQDIATRLLTCTSGETPRLRAAVLSMRFAFFYWKLFGNPESFHIRVAGVESTVDASSFVPAAYADPKFEDLFRFEQRADHAVMTINQFAWSDKSKFFAFTKDAFTRMKAAHVKTLIIDIRGNTGGDDDMWVEGIMPYIATQSFRNGSDYVLKVIEGRPIEGHNVGDVVTRSQTTSYPSAENNPLRFTGKVYVLIGAATYSSSILFSNVAQDMRFATIAGTGGAARGTQSGGTQNVKLPNTGIVIVVPRFFLKRPSGLEGLVQPDIFVADDPFRPESAIDALLRR